MRKQSTLRRFARYVIPSVTGMLVTSLYVVVDGVFVGRGVGPHGLAAINLVWPFIAVYIAVAMMIGVGGAALCAHALGGDQPQEAQALFGQSLWLILGAGAVFTLAGFFLTPVLCRLLGADEAILPHCVDYLRWYMVFAIPNGLSMVYGAFARNDNDPALAFVAMIAGSVLNVALDYVAIFVLQGGMVGAAVATGLGQLASALMLGMHFTLRRGRLRLALPRPHRPTMGLLLRTGTPELLQNLCCPVSMLAYNYALMLSVGAQGVAAYGIIAYILTILTSLFTGVSQGIQPILSYSCGAGDTPSLRRFFRLGLGLNLGLSALLCLLLWVFKRQAIGVFTTDAALARVALEAFGLYLPSCLFGAVNVVCVTYFLSVRQIGFANLLSFARGVVLILLFILLLPPVLGTAGIWLTITAAEAGTLLLALWCFLRLQRGGVSP